MGNHLGLSRKKKANPEIMTLIDDSAALEQKHMNTANQYADLGSRAAKREAEQEFEELQHKMRLEAAHEARMTKPSGVTVDTYWKNLPPVGVDVYWTYSGRDDPNTLYFMSVSDCEQLERSYQEGNALSGSLGYGDDVHVDFRSMVQTTGC